MATPKPGGLRLDLEHPYIRALLAARVRADQVILQAEALGSPPEALLCLAETLTGGRRGGAMAALMLVLGAAGHWQPFAAMALASGTRFLQPILHPPFPEDDALSLLLGQEAMNRLCRTGLERLGYPDFPARRAAGEGARCAVLPWLEQGRGLVLAALELTRFASRAPAWGQVLVDDLVLGDGAAPEVLWLASGDPDPGRRLTRLHRIRGLRSLEGLQHLSSLVATDCPDLEDLPLAPPILVLKGCSSLRRIQSNPRTRLLHLQDCPQLEAWGTATAWDSRREEELAPTHRNVVVSGCPALRDLPGRLEVTGHLALRGIGPIRQWPAAFRVGGDLRLRDCPDLEALPVLEVRGSLRVAGASGLRRLAPGTVVGLDLDLRACRHLEGFPHGVEVGRALRLPAHLGRPGVLYLVPEPLPEIRVDRTPIVRDLLLGLSFPRLARPAERPALRDRAEAALAGLKGALMADPGMEADLIWTASEVWRDLSEQLWAEDHPGSCDGNPADGDLPLAWFQNLLLAYG